MASSVAALAFGLMVVLFGLNFVAVRVSNAELTPFWGAASRFAIVAGLLAVIVVARKIEWPRGRALVGAALYGTLAVGALYGLMYWALVTAPASPAAIMFATIPLMTLGIAWSIRQERFRPRILAGALLALVGAIVVFRDQLRADVPRAAMVAILLAAFASALSGVVVKGFPRSHPVATNAVGMTVGAVMLLVAALLFPGERMALPQLRATWIAFTYLVVSSIVAFVILVWLIGRWGASRASYSAVLIPIVTTVAAVALAGERVTLSLAIGGAIVLAGVWIGALGGAGDDAPAERGSAAT